MNTPTIYEIKRATYYKAPHFFDRKTLGFFGQTMRSFTVRKSPEGRVFIYAPMYYDRKRPPAGYTFREFVNGALEHPRTQDGERAPHDTLEQITRYISTH